MTKTAKIIQELEIRVEMLEKFIEAEVNSLFVPDIININLWRARRSELVSMLSFANYTMTEQEYTND